MAMPSLANLPHTDTSQPILTCQGVSEQGTRLLLKEFYPAARRLAVTEATTLLRLKDAWNNNQVLCTFLNLIARRLRCRFVPKCP